MISKTAGEIAFEAYNTAKGGVTYDGKPIPPWSAVGPEVQGAWEAAATAVADEILIRLDHRPDELLRRARDSVRALVPSSREQSLTMTKIDEASMWLGAVPMRAP